MHLPGTQCGRSRGVGPVRRRDVAVILAANPVRTARVCATAQRTKTSRSNLSAALQVRNRTGGEAAPRLTKRKGTPMRFFGLIAILAVTATVAAASGRIQLASGHAAAGRRRCHAVECDRGGAADCVAGGARHHRDGDRAWRDLRRRQRHRRRPPAVPRPAARQSDRFAGCGGRGSGVQRPARPPGHDPDPRASRHARLRLRGLPCPGAGRPGKDGRDRRRGGSCSDDARSACARRSLRPVPVHRQHGNWKVAAASRRPRSATRTPG